MNCLSPIEINFKRPIINHDTGEIKYRGKVPCGRCEACLERKRLDWFVRLKEEHRHSCSSFFFTLTYADEHLPYKVVDDVPYPTFDKRQVQLFLKRLRSRIYPATFRYYLISEYGTRYHRPHYHFHYFGSFIDKDELYRKVSECWPFGFVHIGDCNDSTLNYVCGHVQYLVDIPKNYDRPFYLMSRRPGLGSQSLAIFDKIASNDDVLMLYADEIGKRYTLPRYYRDRIYNRKTKHHRVSYLDEKIEQPNEEQIRSFRSKILQRRKSRLKTSVF